MMARSLVAALLLTLAAPGLAAPWEGAAQSQPAISGYDPVAYFTAGKPMPGLDYLSYAWDGTTFRFASAADRAAFIADPARYAPQFGGHCAWAASQGRLAKPDPTLWQIVDGKLYLNCSKEAEAKWLADVPGNIAKGQAFWAAQGGK